MENTSKHELILNALQELLQERDIDRISVNDIAEKAGIGKGSIYYYFPSKEAIIDSLIERNYKKPLETAHILAKQTDISPEERMAKIFQACQESSEALLQKRKPVISEDKDKSNTLQEQAFIHTKYLKYIIKELKPTLTQIIRQQIEDGTLNFAYPEQLAEIVLIVLTVKLDNTLVPSTTEEMNDIFRALISLLEKGANSPTDSLNYLIES